MRDWHKVVLIRSERRFRGKECFAGLDKVREYERVIRINFRSDLPAGTQNTRGLTDANTFVKRIAYFASEGRRAIKLQSRK
jgi:hypothetical protein